MLYETKGHHTMPDHETSMNHCDKPMSDIENAVHDIEQVPAYRVGDKVYPDFNEALLASKNAEFTATINAFISSREWGRGRDTAAANVLRAFLTWQAINVPK